MTGQAVSFLLLGATILWGGLMLTLGITIKNEKVR
ncbi:MetS family NSS transporter small subunit [Clostridium weizhouense]|uniref:MetS family NSS transporter small subunit n=1 Tax=Clostridium weizhouense TaxID=2859781 RepID=A0ABS7ALY7_9CLOT|nr:MetS family NSS transporter small subunit [Clostridium weizhouense]MBW6409671.1 MetS family NSS transporter small subunit [Clostridium weizhouense]